MAEATLSTGRPGGRRGVRPRSLEAASAAGPATITARHVTKTFGHGSIQVTALDDVSIDVEEGSFVSLLGPSGCGKSTMMRLIAGLQEPTEGSLEIGNVTPDDRRRLRDFGIVFQSPVLFDWRTVEENVMLPLQIMRWPKARRRERAQELIELVGLKDFAKRYPWQLSGGMQQRVAIARALTFEPPLLLMDEPFGALDMMTRERMQTELLSIWAKSAKSTVVFITHSISEAVLLSDRIVVMSARPGRVLKVIDVDLERPRTEETREIPRYGEIISSIRHLLFSQEQP
ncbi:ABC transporter ATP-binding protein [Aeromicrobium sp. YIM 150415]|uniref:ABC transporter ATP-binding protein n=1 Tax=Aeromicrobium sp. YIM 150415 TaxID=2803912 RepID=UPI00196692F9|nr:ABC transporter ATP-binding protein [Aeromicrobium sp. YIM 150415]MBM9464505.1 ABC transporter ATP-binding protein [Aeromicrobium sp. YIM 150415]